jgi:CheY-like chemotaxis protein
VNKQGAIIIIEDDSDDKFVIAQILESLNYANPVLFFSNGEKVFDFLDSHDEIPFLILSDRDVPKSGGFELRKRLQMNKRLALRYVPFLLFTTEEHQQSLTELYRESFQGFFIKPNDFDELRDTLKTIIEYWKRCVAPNPIDS